MQRIFKPLFTDRTNLVVLLILVAITVLTSIGSAAINLGANSEWWVGWLQNFSTEMSGAIATFLLFELMIGERANIQRMLLELRSPNADEGRRAALEAKEVGILSDGTLKGKVLRDANLEGANLRNANLGGVQLIRAKLAKTDLRDSYLVGANLYEADLQGTDLDGANLARAVLENAILTEANLADTNLDRAQLYGTNLFGADLRRAQLADANLWGTNMVRADLRGANLAGACMANAYLSGAELNGARISNKTVLPDAVQIEVDADGTLDYDKYWTPKTDMMRYTDPTHPDFWQPDWVLEELAAKQENDTPSE